MSGLGVKGERTAMGSARIAPKSTPFHGFCEPDGYDPPLGMRKCQ
jgi:hypothetical protein